MDEYGAVCGERADQVGEVFALHSAPVFHPFNRVIAEAQGAVFDFGKPSSEAPEREWILLAGVDDRGGQRRADLRASSLASTGRGGCGTGAVSVVQASGDGIRVRLRGIGQSTAGADSLLAVLPSAAAKAL